MSEIDLDICELEYKKWKCPICSKILTRKQTLRDHLWNLHQKRAGPNKVQYKKYEIDETVSIPRSTLYRWETNEKRFQNEGDSTFDFKEKEGGCTEPRNVLVVADEELNPAGEGSTADHHEFSVVSDEISRDHHELPLLDESITVTNHHEHHLFDDTCLPSLYSQEFYLMDICDEQDMDIDTSDHEENETYNGHDSGTDNPENTDKFTDDENKNDPPLYVIPAQSQLAASSITVNEHTFAIGAYAARHNISDVAFKDLLSLLQLHIPNNNIGETSVRSLKTKCGFDKNYLNFHLYCEVCKKLYGSESDGCLTPGCTGNRVRYFATSNLCSQLQEVLHRGTLWQLTRKHMQVVHKNICDIQGGLAYQELLKPGKFLHNSNNVTLSAFTDGVALFKSSGVQLWPVYLLINEIPPTERFHRKNMLLWGIWQGKGKPRMNMFLRPLIIDLLNLYHNGADIVINSETINVRAMLVVATMDLPARAYVTNMTQYNGKYGCLYCEDEGTVVPSGAGTCRAFLSRAEPAKLRTVESVSNCSLEAFKKCDRVMGFLGISVLSYLPYFSLISNVQIDYMHGILLGITKKLMDNWFDDKFKETKWFIGNRTVEIDKLLTKLQPPYIIHRTPRSIEHTLKKWKASEFRNWLLYYGIPCLIGFLPTLYLKHFSLLVEGTYLLLSTGITSTDLNNADILLKAFVENAQLLYGENFMGLNVHNLIHLVPMVKMWGPLWAWSCFPFESFNGEIKKTIHGTGNVCRQIFWSFQAEKRILFETAHIRPESCARQYIEQLFNTHDGLYNCTDAYMCQIVMPKSKTTHALSGEEKQQILRLSPFYEGNLIKLLKVIRNGYVFYTKGNNSEESKQNSYTFLLDPRAQQIQDSFAFEAHAFLLHEASMKVICKGTFIKSKGSIPGMSTTHLHIMEYGEKGVTKVESLLEPLIMMPMKDILYCTRFPNIYERD